MAWTGVRVWLRQIFTACLVLAVFLLVLLLYGALLDAADGGTRREKKMQRETGKLPIPERVSASEESKRQPARAKNVPQQPNSRDLETVCCLRQIICASPCLYAVSLSQPMCSCLSMNLHVRLSCVISVLPAPDPCDVKVAQSELAHFGRHE